VTLPIGRGACRQATSLSRPSSASEDAEFITGTALLVDITAHGRVIQQRESAGS
jgi:hypothetical protein